MGSWKPEAALALSAHAGLWNLRYPQLWLRLSTHDGPFANAGPATPANLGWGLWLQEVHLWSGCPRWWWGHSGKLKVGSRVSRTRLAITFWSSLIKGPGGVVVHCLPKAKQWECLRILEVGMSGHEAHEMGHKGRDRGCGLRQALGPWVRSLLAGLLIWDPTDQNCISSYPPSCRNQTFLYLINKGSYLIKSRSRASIPRNSNSVGHLHL